METGELVGNQIEANKREERQKVVQFTIPKSLADEFKGACGRNGRAMKDVVEDLMNRYVQQLPLSESKGMS